MHSFGTELDPCLAGRNRLLSRPMLDERKRGSSGENYRETSRQRQRLKESSLPQAFNHETHKDQETTQSHGSPPFC